VRSRGKAGDNFKRLPIANVNGISSKHKGKEPLKNFTLPFYILFHKVTGKFLSDTKVFSEQREVISDFSNTIFLKIQRKFLSLLI
jgi:hypothetical protein